MEALLRQTWDDVLPKLRAEVGSGVYEAWIARLRPTHLERGICHLEAPSRMALERVQRQFAGVIGDRLSDAFGTRIEVLVQLSPAALLPDRLEVGPSRPIVDSSNRMAVLALQALLDGRPMPSPLYYFHGPSGAGKTFLLSWWSRAWDRGPKPLVFAGDGLLKAFQATTRERRSGAFVDELCAEDRPLVLDEVHRMSGRTKLQELVSRVLQRRADLDVPTLLASRWHPHDVWDLDAGLATWMLSGFSHGIEHPGQAARLQYLRALEGGASRNGRAAEIERLARESRGGYVELRQVWLRHRIDPSPQRFQLIEPRVTFDRIAARVSERMDIPLEDLVGQSQKRRVSQARKTLAWLCVREGLSRAEVGRYLGRTRAAISYSVQSLGEAMDKDRELRAYVESLW